MATILEFLDAGSFRIISEKRFCAPKRGSAGGLHSPTGFCFKCSTFSALNRKSSAHPKNDLELDYFRCYAFSGNLQQSNRRLTDKRRFRICGASGIDLKDFSFPLYAGGMGVTVNKHIKEILIGNLPHFTNTVY